MAGAAPALRGDRRIALRDGRRADGRFGNGNGEAVGRCGLVASEGMLHARGGRGEHGGGAMVNLVLAGSPEQADVVLAYGSVVPVHVGLPEAVRAQSVLTLNRLLAHTMAVRDLYKKAHWQTAGATFYELHRLFDVHHAAQVELIDVLAERVGTLGGVALALSHDVAEESRISRAPRGRESAVHQLRRFVDAHEMILEEARPLAREAGARGDEGTTDIIVSEVVRTNELQAWFIAQHLTAHEAHV